MTQAHINLRLMLLNAENLFLLSDLPLSEEQLTYDEVRWQRLSTSIYPNKPLKKAIHLKKVILEAAPDIVLLCEVGGLESLTNFNSLFLENRYSPVLIEGNSERNIDVGFLVRRDIGFYFDLVSNKNRPINYLYPHERSSQQELFPIKSLISNKFSRDVAELHLFQAQRENPFMIILLTHLKSRLDPDGIDPNGFERRQAEFAALLEIYQELENRFDSSVPIAVCGDLNGRACRDLTDQEFKLLYDKTQLEDICELAGLKSEDRCTYHQVQKSRIESKQLDYCFLSPLLAQYLNKETVKVIRYLDSSGLPLDPPTSLEAKERLPSDHYPLVFDLQKLPIR